MAKSKKKKSSGVVALLGGALSGVWRLIAKGFGGSVRFVARGAKDLDPEHQRDGFALLLVIIGLAAVGGTWLHGSNLVSRYLYSFFYGGFGRIGVLTPLVFF